MPLMWGLHMGDHCIDFILFIINATFLSGNFLTWENIVVTICQLHLFSVCCCCCWGFFFFFFFVLFVFCFVFVCLFVCFSKKIILWVLLLGFVYISVLHHYVTCGLIYIIIPLLSIHMIDWKMVASWLKWC